MTNMVLILDDSKSQLKIIANLFEKNGFASDFSYTHDEAFLKLRSQRYDLVLLDVFVGQENTLEYIDKYRSAARGAPLAIMTAGKKDMPSAGSLALNKARRAEVDFLLPKPFNLADIRQVCAEAGRIRRLNSLTRRILLIDDDARTRLIYRDSLEEEGFYVAESSSVSDALVRLRLAPVDAILFSLVLSGVSSVAGIKTISAEWPNMPIIAINGYVQNFETVRDALSAGAFSVLPEPFSKAALVSELDKAVNGGRIIEI